MEFLTPYPFWRLSNDETPQMPKLDNVYHADVAIIGAGVTGLTAALHLKRAGKRVIVLEAGRIGGGTTGGSTGHLDVMPDQGFVKLAADFGKPAARDVTAARQAAIDQIETWTQELDIDCDFQRLPARFFSESKKHADRIQAEYDAARAIGLDATLQSDAGLPWPAAAAIELAGQGRFHPLKYLYGLAGAVDGDGSAIFEHTRAEPPEDGTPCRVIAGGHVVSATHIILATHSAFLGVSQFDLRQAPYQSYAIAVRVEEEIDDALFWDDAQPYHYIRRAASEDPQLLIVGGADHKTGQADARQHLRRLVDYVSQRMTVVAVQREWSAEFFKPCDGLPFIGRVPLTKRLYIATGLYGTGLTFGTLAGKILADLIVEGRSSDADLFSPSRMDVLASAKGFITENANVARHFIGDRFGAAHVASLDAVRPGTGRLIRFEGENYAAYRDEHNELHLMSPVCTHAGCCVQWNNVEKTWDCPCHGGRYSATGERLCGPPPRDLKPKEAPVHA